MPGLRGATTFPPDDVDNVVLALGIDPEDADDPTLAAAAAAAATASATAIAATRAALKVTTLDGADETTPPGEIYAVVGMSATSEVVSVLFVSTKAAVATIEVLDPADFDPGVDTLTSLDEVDRTSDQLIVTWFDV